MIADSAQPTASSGQTRAEVWRLDAAALQGTGRAEAVVGELAEHTVGAAEREHTAEALLTRLNNSERTDRYGAARGTRVPQPLMSDQLAGQPNYRLGEGELVWKLKDTRQEAGADG
jgi:hypothetical protein